MKYKPLAALGVSVTTVLLAAGCLSSRQTLPLKDDFSGGCKWPDHEGDTFKAGCHDGEYRLTLKMPGQQGVSLEFSQESDALRVEADSVVRNGPADETEAFTTVAVACYAGEAINDEGGPDGRGYIFAVTREGAYVVLRDPGNGKDRMVLVAREAGTLSLRAGANRIGGDCVRRNQRTTLVLRLNGAVVAVANDKRTEESFRWIGLAAATNQPSADVRFDNVAARAVTPREIDVDEAMKATVEEGTGHLPLADDFSNPGSGWTARQYSDVSLAYADDAYRMSLIKPKPQLSLLTLPAGVDGISVDATAARKTGPSNAWMGVACYSSETQGYALAVSPAGKYAIRREVDGDSSVVAQGRTNLLGNPNEPVRVSAQCVGGERETTILTLAVNGTQIAYAADSEGVPYATFSAIGLYGYANGSGTELTFDDFAGRKLSGEQIYEIRTVAAVRPPSRQAPKILYQDRFSSRSSWPVGKDETGNLRLDRGAYRMTVRPGQNLVLFASATVDGQSAVALSVDLLPGPKTSLGQTFAVACALDQDQAYSFGIEAAAGRYGIWRSTNVFGPGFMHGVSSAIRKAPAVNHIVAQCRGGVSGKTHLSLRVNGRMVARATDEDGLDRFDSYALVVGAPNGADGGFDNLTVRRLG